MESSSSIQDAVKVEDAGSPVKVDWKIGVVPYYKKKRPCSEAWPQSYSV